MRGMHMRHEGWAELMDADDIVLGFQYQTDADRFRENLAERLRKFGLELHPDKTRRIEFGRFAELNRTSRSRASLACYFHEHT